jgi:RimJ/RimL family protein N-acetyltransferase
MAEAAMETRNLTLLLKTTDEALASIEAMSPSDRAQVSPAWLERLKAAAPTDPWMTGFSMVLRESGAVIGNCGYKGPPGAEGVVEIAYGVAPEHQGKGYATEAARALSEFAYSSGAVRLVIAHTLPMASASTSVLTKCGFTRVGDVIDPDDGLVWRWELWPRRE